MIYFTISKLEGGNLIDRVSLDYNAPKNKLSDEKIYQSDKPILSIYIVKEQLHEVSK